MQLWIRPVDANSGQLEGQHRDVETSAQCPFQTSTLDLHTMNVFQLFNSSPVHFSPERCEIYDEPHAHNILREAF
jgi:hypothetical protein